MKITASLLVVSLSALANAADPLSIYGCSGRSFTGRCQTFTCPLEACCVLPSFFQTSLVSVRSTGRYNFLLFTAAGCYAHCNDNDNQARLVDSAGWSNIGAAAYQCIDGPY